jgi:DNA-binding beta-propeller fold protein YncE
MTRSPLTGAAAFMIVAAATLAVLLSAAGAAGARPFSAARGFMPRDIAASHGLGAWTSRGPASFRGFGDPLGFGFGSALVGSAPTQDGPSLLAVDPATHTVYIVNGDNADGPNQGGDTVSVIDTRHCNAEDVNRCRGPWPTVTVGNDPTAVAVDFATDTVYVANGGDFADPSTVSVFNGATCNAEDFRGCGQTPAEVPVGIVPVAMYADRAVHTVYVANAAGDTVSMIDTATCDATHLSDCPTTEPPAVTVGNGPSAVDVDESTHTVYVGQIGGIATFDADTCNAATQAGCGEVGTLGLGNGDQPFGVAVDPDNQTLYTANGDNTISVFDLRECKAGDLGGCATDTPGTVAVAGPQGFDGSLWVAVDRANHTVYVPFSHDDALMVFDAATCNGRHLSACAGVVPREIHTGTEPESAGLDSETQTLYTGDEVDDSVSVIDASRCDADTTVGCRRVPPTIAFPQGAVSIADPAVDTVYVPSSTGVVGMLDSDTCNAAHPHACPSTPVTFTAGDTPFGAIVNPGTHTVYISNAGNGSDGSISVIDDRTCNATTQAGCSSAATLEVPAGAVPIAADVDLATDTVYVATDTEGFASPTYLYVFNGATCNATTHSGCGQTPVAVALGPGGPSGVAVDQATNTVYVAQITSFGTDTPGVVDVIDGATCNGTEAAGCSGLVATIPVGVAPQQVGVDQATDTVYTANEADTDYQGTASIINGATCNATDMGGCDQTATTVPVGFGPLDLWVDQAHNEVWIENTQDTSVSILYGAACNGQHESQCARPWPKVSVVDYPNAVAFADDAGTAYVSGWTGISVVPLMAP